ncbi:MAG: plasmid pRiA4b ORF-3 family protein [Cytophagaceae bacterium]
MPNPIKLKINLEEMPYEISRKILVPHDINMMQLHYVIQLAMGWTFSHLFQFCDKKWKSSIIASYGLENDYDVFDVEETPADQVKLKSAFLEKGLGKPFWYWYDFGDDWWHKITFLKAGKKDIAEFEGAPKCVEAIGLCPPEDVGGSTGYDHFLEIINDANHPDHKDFRIWAGIPLGIKYETENINIKLVNAYLTGYFFSPDWKLSANKFFNTAPTPFLKNLF